jgi:hypothetical protein
MKRIFSLFLFLFLLFSFSFLLPAFADALSDVSQLEGHNNDGVHCAGCGNFGANGSGWYIKNKNTAKLIMATIQWNQYYEDRGTIINQTQNNASYQVSVPPGGTIFLGCDVVFAGGQTHFYKNFYNVTGAYYQ